jgi:hypothetical protein
LNRRFKHGNPATVSLDGEIERETMILQASQFLATLSTTLFCGADLDKRSAAAQWAASYKRATWMQAPLAIIGFLAGIGSWIVDGGPLWLIAALFIGAVVPFTLIFAMPTNKRLLWADRGLTSPDIRDLLDRWGKIHKVRTV